MPKTNWKSRKFFISMIGLALVSIIGFYFVETDKLSAEYYIGAIIANLGVYCGFNVAATKMSTDSSSANLEQEP